MVFKNPLVYKQGWIYSKFCMCVRHAQAYLQQEKGNYVLFVFPECVCMRAHLHDSVLFVCVFMLRLTAKLELGWLLLWGVNLGLGGFPASLSLCLLLFMCCRDQKRNRQRTNKHLLYHSGTTSNVICWIINGYTLSVKWTDITSHYFLLQPHQEHHWLQY